MKAPEFYVGYIAHAPRQIGRYIARTSTTLCVIAVAIAVLLVFAQAPFAASKFEYGVNRDFTGRLRIAPYPVLLDTSGVGRYLLVAPGKHGATSLLESMDGRQVHIRGSLIERDGDRMVEVLAAEPVGGDESKKPEEGIGAAVSLTGEIVDSKCYLGVMNPGFGKVHKDCAIRCISGGIPPAFLVRDRSGSARILLLTDSDGRPLNSEVLDYVAEPVRLRGTLVRSGAGLVLRADLSTIDRLDKLE